MNTEKNLEKNNFDILLLELKSEIKYNFCFIIPRIKSNLYYNEIGIFMEVFKQYFFDYSFYSKYYQNSNIFISSRKYV